MTELNQKLWSGAGQLMFKERGLLTGKNIIVAFWPAEELDVFAGRAVGGAVTFFNSDYRNHRKTEEWLARPGA